MITTNGLTDQTKRVFISGRAPTVPQAMTLLATFPSSCIDCALTSPPYWGQRAYASGGIGLEETWQEYVDNLLRLFKELQRVLKPTGSFWLNIGDAY
jgi:site-specific DNA-methyltransferase (adenine-specific)